MVQRVIIYARVSTEDQHCERQVSELTKFAKRCGFKLIETVCETASGANNDRKKRQLVMDMARLRKIDVILISELTRWGRSTEDLLATLQQLADWKVSVLTLNGMQFDMATPQGKLMVTMLAGISEFERGLLRERIKSGIAHAKAQGKKLGRQAGHNPSDKYAKQVLKHINQDRSYRWIAHEMQISKTTVLNIAKRAS